MPRTCATASLGALRPFRSAPPSTLRGLRRLRTGEAATRPLPQLPELLDEKRADRIRVLVDEDRHDLEAVVVVEAAVLLRAGDDRLEPGPLIVRHAEPDAVAVLEE